MDDRVEALPMVSRQMGTWSVGALSPSGLDWQIADRGLPEDEADLDFFARQDGQPAW